MSLFTAITWWTCPLQQVNLRNCPKSQFSTCACCLNVCLCVLFTRICLQRQYSCSSFQRQIHTRLLFFLFYCWHARNCFGAKLQCRKPTSNTYILYFSGGTINENPFRQVRQCVKAVTKVWNSWTKLPQIVLKSYSCQIFVMEVTVPSSEASNYRLKLFSATL